MRFKYYNRSRELTKSNILKFSQSIEQAIQSEIEDAYPTEWNENYLTLRFCKALRKSSFTQIELQNNYINVFINTFKFNGKNEHKFGDIAIILDVGFKDSDRINGVALLEAKLRYDNSNEYIAIAKDQLERLFQLSPSSRLLLYNYQPMSILAPTGIDISKVAGGGLLPKMPVTYTSVVPTNTAIHLNRKNDRLHKASIPFTYQFVFRYLFGMELEYDNEKVEAAKGYGRDKYGMPDYSIYVTVVQGKKEEKEVTIVQPPINRELYTEILDPDEL